MQPTIRRKNPLAYAVLALFLGPFSLFFINFWIALFVLCVPVVFCTVVDFYFLDGNLNVLGQYFPSLIVWAAAYWVMCTTLAYKGANWHNQMLQTIRSTSGRSRDLIPDEMKTWLLENPEATVNDYYAIAKKAPIQNFPVYVEERPVAKVVYTLSMR